MSNNSIGFRRRLLLLALILCGAALATWSLGALAFRPTPVSLGATPPPPAATSAPLQTSTPLATPVPLPTSTPVPPPGAFDFTQPAPLTSAAEEGYFNDAVFLGDSRTDGLRLYSGIRGADFLAYKALMVFQVTGTHGMEQKKIPVGENKVTVLNALEGKQYGKVYIMFGINELGWGRDNSFAEAFTQLIDDVRLRQPDAIIYIESLVPVNPDKCQVSKSPTYITNDKIAVYNDILKQVSAEKGAVYLDLAGELGDNGVLPAEATVDGIHLVKSYYVKWFDYLKTHTVDKPSYDAGQSALEKEVPTHA